MTSNPSFRNLSIHTIVQQNDELRHALVQCRQNELLIEELASKIDFYKSNEIELLSLNAVLTEALNAQKATISERENAYNEEMQYVFSQHDKILFAKDQDLKSYKYELQKLAERTRQAEDYARVYQERERQLSDNYEIELTNYKNKIGDFQGELDSVYRSSQREKASFEKARSSWGAQKQAQNAQIINLTNIIRKFEADNLMLIEYSKELEGNLIRTEEQNKNTLISLREKLIQQQDEIHSYLYKNKGLQNSNQIIAKELEDVKRLQAHLASDNQSLTTENDKIINLLAETDQESKYLRSHITELELSLSKNLQKNEIQLQDLRSQKLELLRSKTEAETYANAKVAELRELSASVNKFQVLASKQEGHIKSLTTDLNDLQLLLSKEKQRTSQQSITIKELSDSNTAFKVELDNYYSINSKLQIQIEQLQSEAMTLAKTSLSSKDINKQFIEQMNTMLIKFREEREEQSRLHILEREKLKERYQFEIKQRQLDSLKKISLLEEQLAISQKFQILTERNNNIYTFTTTKF